MRLDYSDERIPSREELQDLFLSVDWESGKYPDQLARAAAGSSYLVSVRDMEHPDKLVGLVSCVGDGHMNVYVPYMLVRPEYQGRGVGRELMTRVLHRFRDVLRISLIAYDDAIPFYERCGFSRGEGKMPMFVAAM